MPGRFVPDELGVAALVADDGVAFVLDESSPAIATVGQALAAARAGVGRDDHFVVAVLPAGGVLFVDDGAAGERPVAMFPVVDRDRQLLPMHEVGAHSVPPVHVAPFPAVRVVLKIEMPLAVEVHEAVRIIVPTDALREVELRA